MNTELLRKASVLMAALASLVLMVDWQPIFGDRTEEKKSPVQTSPDPNVQKFLSMQYEAAIKEIQMRLEQESMLFGFKFALVGAVLATFFTTIFKEAGQQTNGGRSRSSFLILRSSPMLACFLWVAVITSGIVDCRIQFNVDFIKTLGTWIGTQVEPRLLAGQEASAGWEAYLSQSDLMKSRFYPLLFLNAHLLTIFLFLSVLALTFSSRVARRPDSKGLLVSSVGAGGAMVVFWLASLHYGYSHTHFCWAGMIRIVALVFSLVPLVALALLLARDDTSSSR
ncbi:MAG: hypothetical protein B7Z37_25115 [Verrucomicrobia bacterium 12-59-8]|nr:MAG: hypothetical protein B7Z37_25115 [Verrucomicrobia bacterium 12-59-8]